MIYKISKKRGKRKKEELKFRETVVHFLACTKSCSGVGYDAFSSSSSVSVSPLSASTCASAWTCDGEMAFDSSG